MDDVVLKKNRRKFQPSQLVLHVILLLWASTTIYPLVWVFNNSFKDKDIILVDSFSLINSSTSTLANYVTAFTKMNIGRSYANSLIISGSVVVLVMFFGGLAAYIIARYDFFGKKVIHASLIAALLFPAFATIVPVFMILMRLDLVNKHIGVIIPQTAGNLAFAIIILVGFMSSIPIELEESAVVEGCSPWQIFSRIVVPVSKPSFSTVAIFTFLWSYNDLFLQMVILRKRETFPISALLNEISSQYGGTDFGLMAAAVTLVIIPVLIVYLLMQQNIIKGLTAGAVKG
ncbi:MAG: carbohydrate ABC transporter permease [Epulopiscium sp.]|nr:carbohydrate ABC transporter permease [Candidatus Epulonipiscium sp.]